MKRASGARVSIPTILHFTWKTDVVPGRMGDYLAMWRKLHEDWDVRLWTDATMREFVAQDYPEFLAVYDGYPNPIQRADSFRYLVLNRLGGVYADLDVEPFRPIDDLVADLDCFVGVEPYEHIGPDRRHSGVPWLLSNAFMGAAPAHPYFKQICAMLPGVADNPDIFYSTGPSLTTGAAARIGRAERPTVIPPCLWSHKCDGGAPCTTDDRLADLLVEDFDFAWKDRQPYVLHHWLTSWVPFHKRHKWLAKPFHILHKAKWRARALRHPHLASLQIPDMLKPFGDQVPKPLPPLPTIALCITLRPGESLSPKLAASLYGLDYPRHMIKVSLGAFVQSDGEQAAAGESIDRLRAAGIGEVAVHFVVPPDATVPEMTGWTAEHVAMAASARMRNTLAASAAKDTPWVLFIGGETDAIPPDALKEALAIGHSVVGLGSLDAMGQETDLSVHRYHWGGGIRVTYKIMDRDGIASAARGQRDYLSAQKAFRVVPLDGVGRAFTLVRRDVLKAGVSFAERPYHRHLDGEGFALMARENGFEVAGLTEVAATARIGAT